MLFIEIELIQHTHIINFAAIQIRQDDLHDRPSSLFQQIALHDCFDLHLIAVLPAERLKIVEIDFLEATIFHSQRHMMLLHDAQTQFFANRFWFAENVVVHFGQLLDEDAILFFGDIVGQ